MANGNGTAQGSALANELKVALRCISVPIVISLVLVGLAHLFLRRESERPESPGVAVFNWLGQLPTEPGFYYLVAVLAGAYLGWRWYRSVNLREEIRIRKANEDKSSLTPRDWWVVQGLRRRAHAFRTLAGVLLGSVVALLFGGIYLAMFVVPQIPVSDQSLIQEILLTSVKQQFGLRLQLIGEGRYWFKVANVGRDTPTSEESEASIVSWFEMFMFRTPRASALNIHEASKNKRTILIIDHGKAIVTRDGGQTWRAPQDMVLKEDEWIATAAFGADGRFGVIGGSRRSVFVTQDGGQTWRAQQDMMLKEGEWIATAAFGADGRFGVIGGSRSSVFVTQDGGRTWRAPKDMVLKEGEWIATVAFGADGRFGVIGGFRSSVFVTQDGGRTWRALQDMRLEEGEWITTAAFDTDGLFCVVVGDKGSVFVTQNGEGGWTKSVSLDLEEGERIVAAAFGTNSTYGAVSSNKGKIFWTQGCEQIWYTPMDSGKKELTLKETEWIITVAFDSNGQSGVVAGNEGSIFVTQDRGKTWSVPENLVLKDDERMITTAFDADGESGVVVGDKGSVFVTQDGGRAWNKSDSLELKEGERIVAAVFSTDGKHGVVTGGEGSVFATQSSGQSWISTERDYQGTNPFIRVVSALPGDRDFVAVDDKGGIHLLKAYPDMAEWEKRSLDAMRIRIQEDEILRKSIIGREITKFLDSVLGADVNVDDGKASKPGNDESRFSRLFGEFTGMRIVTLVALFFLVHVLVRLHQYSLRLAAFWDARADAVLLARSFAYHSAETFDDLVAALAPDAYDFKSSPKSGHEGMMNLVGQLLRRESRKS